MRSGMITRKVGMSRMFTDSGNHIPVTILQDHGNRVIAQRTMEADGYIALQMGTWPARMRRTTQAARGYFSKANIEPMSKVAEFRVDEDSSLRVGSELFVKHFTVGHKVDVIGVSKGRGFAGSMKRHNFGGMRASHGVSVSHRAHGSTGNSQDPGRVWKGKKMAGHMGNTYVTVQNLEIVATDSDNGLIVIHGSVPGARGTWVLVSDAVKADIDAMSREK